LSIELAAESEAATKDVDKVVIDADSGGTHGWHRTMSSCKDSARLIRTERGLLRVGRRTILSSIL